MIVHGAYLNITPGDFVYSDWTPDDWRRFKRKALSLRLRGYRLTKKEYAPNGDYFEYYKRINSNKTVIITYMCS